ncbi:SusD/RagB family nutrient-binding outer membrane lipoprotein [Chitinophaga japonensis]|uniref:SusD-like starch-binding protein associating with outer membrane n=1 Tax=Chitinophaga japonensis TaxID=104662 RepID=A0A562T3G1_CHIJA|nr:SusD/RagB family nutrient-binding outer membrane lipoprotein [Chitinophaga japonensis]TWI87933.1 SusD-like starch-binding protein associating with outer membrane [Chitinophaga japonensis]
MKKLILVISIGIVALGSSCKKYLDINDNPNTATSGTPEVVLPQALVYTASNISSFNNYGSQLVGYAANAGGYGGFGSAVTYNFSGSTYSGLWSSTYDLLNDFQYVIDQTEALPDYGYFNGVARIMKAMNFQLLVDAYNDVPYREALKGVGELTPVYDKAEDIYADLAVQLDSAISIINATEERQHASSTSNVKDLGVADPMFDGDMEHWLQFANTVKLRLMIRGNGKVTFTNTSFDDAGFLDTDAIVNPGYIKDNGKQNPAWNTWVYSYTGSNGNRAWIPSKFILGFYDGHKLDDYRGYAIYYQFPNTTSNQLGYESNDVPSAPTGGAWLSGANAGSSRGSGDAGNSIGIFKSPGWGQPILLAAESYFLQAEAVVRGILGSGDAKTLFDNGVLASYSYLYRKPDGSYDNNWVPATDYASYLDMNPASYLVHFDLAANQQQQIEAIITQKYIALNFIHGHEAWNEYRRTHYPVIVNGSTDPYLTFASTQSISSRPDRLPTRVLYPNTEAANNSTNVPKGISAYNSFIFWALQ